MGSFSLFCCCVWNKEEHEVPDEDLLQEGLCDIFARRGLYLLMTGRNNFVLPQWNNNMLDWLPDPNSRNFCYNPKTGRTVLYLLSEQGYLKRDRGYKIPSQKMLNKFLDAFTLHYEEQHGISAEKIQSCSNAFLQLFAALDYDNQEFSRALTVVKTTVRGLLTEKTKRLSDVVSINQYDLLDLMFLPLFLTGLECRIWNGREIDISLANSKCVLLLKLEFSDGNNAADWLRAIYKVNPLLMLDGEDIFPDGIGEYIVIVLSFNVENKAVAVCSIHKSIVSSVKM